MLRGGARAGHRVRHHDIPLKSVLPGEQARYILHEARHSFSARSLCTWCRVIISQPGFINGWSDVRRMFRIDIARALKSNYNEASVKISISRNWKRQLMSAILSGFILISATPCLRCRKSTGKGLIAAHAERRPHCRLSLRASIIPK